MIELVRLKSLCEIKDIDIYRSFTVENNFLKLDDPTIWKNLVFVAITYNHLPIGCGILLKQKEKNSVLLHSIYIKSEFRNKKIGTRLLSKLEEELKNDGDEYFNKLYTRFPYTSSFGEIVQRMLEKQNWTIDKQTFVGKGDLKKLDWLNRKVRIPKNFEVFKWKDLTQNERIFIKQKQAKENWFDPGLSPFQDESMIEPLNSLGVRYNGEVLGWMITHRTMPDIISYSALFVDPPLLPSRIGAHLIRESMSLHFQLPNEPLILGAFNISQDRYSDTPGYGNFLKNKLHHLCDRLLESRYASKELKKITI